MRKPTLLAGSPGTEEGEVTDKGAAAYSPLTEPLTILL
jgi:hypothetical protein